MEKIWKRSICALFCVFFLISLTEGVFLCKHKDHVSGAEKRGLELSDNDKLKKEYLHHRAEDETIMRAEVPEEGLKHPDPVKVENVRRMNEAQEIRDLQKRQHVRRSHPRAH